MKIAVAYKWAADPSDASVNADGQIDWSRAKAAISEYDAVAIQVARDLATANGAELIGLTAGPPQVAAPLAAKAALSRGLDRLIAVIDEDLAGAGAVRTGQALAGAIRQAGEMDLVVMGDCSIDQGAGLVPATTAGVLGWPAMLEAGKVTIEGATVRVVRHIAGGTEELELTGPAVIGVAAGAATPKPPGMKDVLAAAKKPVQRLTAAEAGAGPALGRVVGAARLDAPARQGVVIDVSDATAAAAELIGALTTSGVALGGQK
jgi:electron transfer flavoprotein beta subunit